MASLKVNFLLGETLICSCLISYFFPFSSFPKVLEIEGGGGGELFAVDEPLMLHH